MTRESNEVSETAYYEQFGTQLGNPDLYGYPGEADIILTEQELEDLLDEPGQAPF